MVHEADQSFALQQLMFEKLFGVVKLFRLPYPSICVREHSFVLEVQHLGVSHLHRVPTQMVPAAAGTVWYNTWECGNTHTH